MKIKLAMLGLSLALALQASDPPGTGANAGKLSLILPHLFGDHGLVLPNPDHAAHFDSAFRSSFVPFNAALAGQLTSLPIPSPASGFTYSFDQTLGVATRSAQSFGPILAERSETIGKDKIYFGVGYQFFRFDALDGLDLNRVPAVFNHQPTTNPAFVKDFISTDNALDIRIGQTTAYATYGVTDRVDVSVAVPLVTARFDVTANATIQRVGTGDDSSVHYFETPDKTHAVFQAGASATGIGDIIVRVKGTVLRTGKAGLALGADLRAPTGDEYNFLGSGAAGVKPFAALSFRFGKISPHLNAAFQWNGHSVLAGSAIDRQKAKLPNEISYVAGADIGVTAKFTVAGDIFGLYRPNSERAQLQPFVAANGVAFPNIAFHHGSIHQKKAALGFKVNAVGNLILAFNILFHLDQQGLRGRMVPLVSASYLF
ncbi:MAG: hypothetical protein U0Q16_31365 [Bryobacteraceae bacterium]